MNILLHAAEGSHGTGIGQHVNYLGRGLIEEGFNVEYLFGRDSSNNNNGYQKRIPKKIADIDFFVSPLLFKSCIKNKHIDIIHSHAQTAYNATLWYPGKSIATLHGTDHGAYEEYLIERNNHRIERSVGTELHFRLTLLKEKITHNRTKSLICVSPGVASEARRYFSNNQYVALNGVDSNEFNPEISTNNLKQKLGIPADKIVILFIGQTDWRKGLPYLISAMKGYEEKYQLIIGGLPTRYKIDNTMSLGILDKELKKRLLATCDIFCLPSLYEGMSLVMLEAMACGKPCILTDVNGTDIISNTEDGIIVKKRDILDIQDAFEYLSEKPTRDEMGWKARETALKYPWENTVKSTIRAYEKSKLI